MRDSDLSGNVAGLVDRTSRGDKASRDDNRRGRVWCGLHGRPSTQAQSGMKTGRQLVRVAPHLLTGTFARQCLLGTTLVTGLQIERVLLNILNDVFLLDFAFKAAKCAFN